jgi:hypothetical protein
MAVPGRTSRGARKRAGCLDRIEGLARGAAGACARFLTIVPPIVVALYFWASDLQKRLLRVTWAAVHFFD